MAEPLNDDEFKDLAERTQALDELTRTREWQLFVDRAWADIQAHQRLVLGGRLDQVEYLREAGWIAGAQALLALPERAQEELRSRAAERAGQAAVEDEDERVEELI